MELLRQTVCLALAALVLALGCFCVRAQKPAQYFIQASVTERA